MCLRRAPSSAKELTVTRRTARIGAADLPEGTWTAALQSCQDGFGTTRLGQTISGGELQRSLGGAVSLGCDKDESVKVAVLSITAAGTGLTLTAGRSEVPSLPNHLLPWQESARETPLE